VQDWKSYGRKLRVSAILTFVLFLIFGGAMLGWRLLDHDRPKGVTALAMTTRSRPIQGRLSGKIRHAPFTPFKLRPRLRGSVPARPKQEEPESSERVRAMAEIFAADLEHPTPRTKADIGVAHLYEGEFQKAVKHLKQAATDAPGEVGIQNDLAAAELAFAQETGDSELLLAAAETAGLAAQAGPNVPEALFNHALALEALHLSNEARRAWDAYLKLDADSAWADEARTRRAALDKPTEAAQWNQLKKEFLRYAQNGDQNSVRNLIGQFPGMARDFVRDELFATWAEAVARDDDATSRQLRLACEVAGETFGRLHQDRFILDAAQRLEGSRKTTRSLAESHLTLRRAQTFYEEKNLTSARDQFEKARAGFARAGDQAFESYAVIGAASCDFHHYLYSKTLRAMESVRILAKQRNYPNLLGRTWWIAGTIFLRQRKTREANYAYISALPLYRQTEDWESHSHISVALGNAIEMLGQMRVAYIHWFRALENLGRVNSAYRRCRVLTGIAVALARNRRVGIAFNFVQEAMETAVTAQDTSTLPFVLYVRAGLYREIGDVGRARADLAEALRRAERCPDRTLRGEMSANALLCQAALDLASDPERAIESLDRACAFLDAAGYRYLSGEAHLLRSRARRRLGDVDGSEEDLRTALRELARDKHSYGYGNSLVSFDDPETVFEEMISLQVKDRGRTDVAFHYADASRSPRLRQQLLGNHAVVDPAATLTDVRQNLPRGVTLIEYAPTADRLYIWVIRPGEYKCYERPVGKVKLDAMVKSFRASIEEAASVREALSESALLYDELIRPIERLIPGTDRVVIIPAGPLQGFPFAALFDAQSQRYLTQAWSISIAPSADLFLIAANRSQKLGGNAPTSALIVGSPSFDRESLPELLPLPGAEAEAVRIAGLYPKANLLLGAQATKEKFLGEAGKNEIIHFAGHALANITPDFSALIFSPGPKEHGEQDRGKLFAHQLKAVRFPQTRIIVLAGCRTGQVSRWRGDGVAGLVSPLLAAGVPAVVTALWDVDDFAALLISVRLHQKLREGASASEALRQAQLEMITHPDARIRAPWVWASFQVIGG
jgi:CHAT domain-containing protein/tetratricopeptide (TPR) repeat protein